jgi:hypothetical protein
LWTFSRVSQLAKKPATTDIPLADNRAVPFGLQTATPVLKDGYAAYFEEGQWDNTPIEFTSQLAPSNQPGGSSNSHPYDNKAEKH